MSAPLIGASLLKFGLSNGESHVNEHAIATKQVKINAFMNLIFYKLNYIHEGINFNLLSCYRMFIDMWLTITQSKL
jgi:hypothetical protein